MQIFDSFSDLSTYQSDREVFSLSLSTVIETASFIGHSLEDRSSIREHQDLELLRYIQSRSSVPLRDRSQNALFSVAPVDILMSRKGRDPEFHVIELNGSGIGGLTNMSATAVGSVLRSMAEVPARLQDKNPLIIIASSGKEIEDAPRLNATIYEKLMYADAMRDAVRMIYGSCRVLTTQDHEALASELPQVGPAIVVGYMKDFLRAFEVNGLGHLNLYGRKVSALVNDRFILNTLTTFPHQIDLSQLVLCNQTYLPGADKSVAYELMNEFLQETRCTFFPEQVLFSKAYDRSQLLKQIQTYLKEGKKVVIKPQGTGLGHGIEFFLDPNEDIFEIASRVNESLSLTEHYYGLKGGAFPYTVTEFIDTAQIDESGHPLQGRKFELRVVVYRDGDFLRAYPSITKVASKVYDGTQVDRAMLINNITNSKTLTKQEGKDFMMPLCNRQTLELLGINIEALIELSQSLTLYVRSILDKIQDQPQRFCVSDFRAPQASEERAALEVEKTSTFSVQRMS